MSLINHRVFYTHKYTQKQTHSHCYTSTSLLDAGPRGRARQVSSRTPPPKTKRIRFEVRVRWDGKGALISKLAKNPSCEAAWKIRQSPSVKRISAKRWISASPVKKKRCDFERVGARRTKCKQIDDCESIIFFWERVTNTRLSENN